ncbi:MAG TPA: GAF domain-containing protein [Solirubrobacteraceae bacterium]|nr:GAF domain-containing protein [Solirubrobacteraceae bacterium]
MPTRTARSDVAVLLRTEHAVARVLASSSDEENAHPRLLAAIGAALGWDFGALWVAADAEGSFLRCEHTWEGAFTPVAAFAEASRSVTLAHGQGMPGEVWRTGRPAWIADAEKHPRPLPRAQAAARAGLHSAFAFPIRCAGNVLGVMEFFAAARVAPDDELLATMSSLGSQIGQFVERCRAERGVRESDARKTAILNAAFDCIITMDGSGHIVEVNAATETTFGYTAQELVGRELAEVMIPPGELREDHRRGLQRYLETGASRIVGHPVELMAMRADGSVFPVELAVTRPDLPGPALFCGYLRDVTERRRAERALQGMAEEQAALRRVATAVAAEVEPERLFGLIAEEVGRALDARIGNIVRFNGDDTALVMGVWSEGADTIGVGTTLLLDGDTVTPQIWRTGRPARMDSIDGLTGNLASMLRERGIRAAVGAPVSFAGTVWGAVVISSADAPFPPESEFRVGDFADLAAQAIANAQAREELAASRMRIVEASDAERRRLERNLHDGAQQRLVATSLTVRLAARRVADDPALRAMLDGAGDELARALEELRELARGLHPAVLSDHGLRAAIEAIADLAPLPVAIDVPIEERLPETVEAAAYFVVCEALTNVAKYAQASEARVRVGRIDGIAQVEVVDDGVGGADDRGGSGLRGLADRVEALGGRLIVSSPAGEGTTVHAQLPVA